MQVTIVPQYPDALADGKLFEFNEYDPTKAYGTDRASFAATKRQLNDRGFEVHTPDQCPPSNADVVVFIDMNFDYLDRLLSLNDRPGLVYVMREPPSVRWYNAASKLARFAPLFDSVLTWNGDLVSGNNNISEYNIPQYLEPDSVDSPPFSEQSLLVNVSSRKYSSHPEELYSERERVAQYYEGNDPEAFTLYGLYWNQRHRIEDIYHHKKLRSREYRTYQGLVDHKATAYANHRFGLCFENMTGIEGYVTEKLFDCIRAGAVPVYWGATDIDQYVPDDIYVDYREFGNPSDLDEYLRSVDEDQYREYRESATSYLAESNLHIGPEQYAKSIADGVSEAVDSSNRSVPYSLRQEVSDLGRIERLSSRPDDFSPTRRFSALLQATADNPQGVLANPGLVLSTVKSFLP